MRISSTLNFCSYTKARILFSGCKILALVKAVAKLLLAAIGPEFGPPSFFIKPSTTLFNFKCYLPSCFKHALHCKSLTNRTGTLVVTN